LQLPWRRWAAAAAAFPTDNFSTLRAAPDRTDLEAPISEVSEVSADMEIRDLGGLRGLR
jgi:hypothetical protein